jgi:hypothetical protein
LASCSKDDTTLTTNNGTVINVDATQFLTASGNVTITTETKLYQMEHLLLATKLLLKSTPTDHNQGPWCPTNITDDATKGGIWIEGNVYDADAFVKNLATFIKTTHGNIYQHYNRCYYQNLYLC